MKTQLISTPQAIMLLFVCQMFDFVTYTPNETPGVESGAILAGTLLSIILTFVFLIPLFLLFKKGNNPDFFAASFKLSGAFGRLVAGYFTLLFLFVLIITGAQFEFFMTNAVFVRASSFLILITLMIACVYGAMMGLEGIVRANSIIFILFAGSIAFILFFAKDKIEWVNLQFVFNGSINSIILTAIKGLTKNMELALLIVLLPKIKGNYRKTSVWYVLISTAVLSLIGVVVILILGKFVVRQVFPFFTVAAIVETELLQRLDALHMAMWVLVTYIRMCIYLIAATQTLKHLLPHKTHKLALPLVSVVTFIGAFLMSRGLGGLQGATKFLSTGIPLGIAVLVIPTILLFGRKRSSEN